MERNTYVFLINIFFGLCFSDDAGNIYIKLCKKQKISKICEIACVNNNGRNTFVSFWHKDEFGDLRKICSTSEWVEGSHCLSNAYTISKRNSSSTIMRINSLQYYDYGYWFCEDKFAKSEEKLMDPYHLKTENIRTTFKISGNKEMPYNFVEVTPQRLLDPHWNVYDIIGVWGFDMEIKIHIPCAYPRPSLKVEIQTENKSCILCEDLWTVQFVESCEVPGHIGSYNFTCNVLKNPYVWNSCFFMMQRIRIAVFQKGMRADTRMYVKKISRKDTVTMSKLENEDKPQYGSGLILFTSFLSCMFYIFYITSCKRNALKRKKSNDIRQQLQIDMDESVITKKKYGSRHVLKQLNEDFAAEKVKKEENIEIYESGSSDEGYSSGNTGES